MSSPGNTQTPLKPLSFKSNDSARIKHGSIDVPGMHDFYVPDRSLFKKQNDFIEFRNDKAEDLFIKNYLLTKLQQKEITLPQGARLNVIAPRIVNEETRTNIRNIIFGDFKGYTNYFFDFVSKPRNEFQQCIENLKITSVKKEQIQEIYDYLDNFYQLKLSLPEDKKVYNLLKLSNQQKLELINKATPETKDLIEAIIVESDNLKELAGKFSRSEVERATLFEAGESSRDFIKKLVAGIFILMGIDHYKSGLVSLVGGEKTMLGKAAERVTEFTGGCGDDLLGSYKDYFQDEVTLGKSTATKVFALSAIAGVTSSWYAAGIPLSTMKGAIIYGNASSGSSIFSNIATFVLMYKNFDKMVDRGIIKLPEDKKSGLKKYLYKLKTVWKNYMDYDAYFGKIIGILACTPAAILAVKTKAFSPQTHRFIYASALMLVGSIESYTAMLVQLLRDNVRKARIKTSKEIIQTSASDPADYDSRKLKVKGESATRQGLKSLKNFFKTFHN